MLLPDTSHILLDLLLIFFPLSVRVPSSTCVCTVCPRQGRPLRVSDNRKKEPFYSDSHHTSSCSQRAISASVWRRSHPDSAQRHLHSWSVVSTRHAVVVCRIPFSFCDCYSVQEIPCSHHQWCSQNGLHCTMTIDCKPSMTMDEFEGEKHYTYDKNLLVCWQCWLLIFCLPFRSSGCLSEGE